MRLRIPTLTPSPADEIEAAASDAPSRSKSRRAKFLQGAAVFAVMFGVLWWLRSRDR